MPVYHCLFVDHSGAVFARETFELHDDQMAIVQANRHYVPHIGRGIELWRDGQCIFVRDDRHNGPPKPDQPLSRPAA
jgi:hypothetical protein